MKNAIIITIGDELLIGQVVDTNSAFIAQALNKIGISVTRRVAIGDTKTAMVDALNESLPNAQLVIITGGLGPTSDDITKPTLCEYFDARLVLHKPTLEHLKVLFEQKLKRPLTERNELQALVPDVCTVLKNPIGTAPGMWFEKNDCVVVAMPGVPSEMQKMVEDELLPKLNKKFAAKPYLHKTLSTFNIPESSLADLLVEFENELPATISLAYLPNHGINRLRLSGVDNFELDKEFEKLAHLVRPHLLTIEDETLEHLVHKLLKAKNKTLSSAESCTGGNIAHRLTLQPGISSVFLGTLVCYSTKIKMEVLGVEETLIAQHTVVSKAVVEDMATQCLKLFGSDLAIATTGIVGPASNADVKPVGTVWIAVAGAEKVVSKELHLRFNRERNIEIATMQALLLLVAEFGFLQNA